MKSFLPRLGLVGGLTLAGIGLSADDVPPGERKSKDAPVVSTTPGATPKDPSPAAPTPSVTNLDEAFHAPLASVSDEILHLTKVVVRGPRPLDPKDVLSPEGKMDRYLGPKDGLDRGVLNRVTLHFGLGFVQLAFFDAIDNETRAKEAFRDDQRLRDRAELEDLASRFELVDKATAALVKQESDRLFLRTTSLGHASHPASPQTAVSDQR